jgi:hypothetical protein
MLSMRSTRGVAAGGVNAGWCTLRFSNQPDGAVTSAAAGGAPAPTSGSGGDEERVSMSPRSVPGNRGVAALSATGSTRRRQWLRGRSTWNVGHRWGSAQCSAAGNRDQRQFDLLTEDSHRDAGSTWNNPGHPRVARGSRPACGLLPVHGGALRVAGSDHTVQFHRPATEVDSGTAADRGQWCGPAWEGATQPIPNRRSAALRNATSIGVRANVDGAVGSQPTATAGRRRVLAPLDAGIGEYCTDDARVRVAAWGAGAPDILIALLPSPEPRWRNAAPIGGQGNVPRGTSSARVALAGSGPGRCLPLRARVPEADRCSGVAIPTKAVTSGEGR